ncbi:HAD-IA family hydrolase [Actinacidiphila bryophytorum]|uniref:Hydrolase of the HAD superfamily n=1 Tax=Actinacidiphila bryophytorum TaxID=1436133 RepID=A0A9W4H4U3_9ACTN|nr:HAD-IA family hydrolase [Actinacidiphila bryophytorum]MBM9435668.1 HAD-IA family hydrolase [Actinacidiphila bryophytorum]MBN6546647.1 HAD-IA family hydrolase [Actinacidiphila bryophytorum]CAG7650803.1 Putative hydrolase of the HAD superfamily [Actinacidiphila bryophytorum]
MTTKPAPRAFDAVLCDVDNVIRHYDQAPLAALERAAGVAEGTTARIAFTPEVDLPLLLGAVTPQQWVGDVTAALAEQGVLDAVAARPLAAALAGAPFAADEAVVGLLRRVREEAGLPLVLVSNASVDLEDDLAGLGLAALADHVVSSARVGVAKPDPRIYAIAAERAGVPAERCLFVDDSRANVEAALALGMSALHYRTPADLHTALQPAFTATAPPTSP